MAGYTEQSTANQSASDTCAITPVFTQQEADDASSFLVPACVDGVSGLSPLPEDPVDACATTIAGLDGSLTERYYRLNNSIDTVSECNSTIAAWGLSSSGITSGIHNQLKLSEIGFNEVFTAVGINGEPMIRSDILTGNIGTPQEVVMTTYNIVNSMATDLITPPYADEGEFLAYTGTLYGLCNIEDNTQIDFRPYTVSGAITETKAWFWDDDNPGSISTATGSSYLFDNNSPSGSPDSSSVMSTILNAGDKVGFALVAWDSRGDAPQRYQFRVNGGSWVNITALSGLSAVGLAVNSI